MTGGLPPGASGEAEAGSRLLAFLDAARRLDRVDLPPAERESATAAVLALAPLLDELGVFQVLALRSGSLQTLVDEVLAPGPG